ncbi:MAG TPA: ABC transporter ATP-binding protein [Phaeodactylibacter sp.]|nr:ABC transporter ATP-binding protein [Phaeodactylibacter sp.]
MSIQAHKLLKQYGTQIAVNEVDLDIPQGEIFGLIGPDGAGKSSLIRMLTTLTLPDGGSARVAGRDIVSDFRQIRKRIGYMPDVFALYEDLSVRENLRFFARVFGVSIEENYDLIREIYDTLRPYEDRRAGKLSGGMKQKLALSCALIHEPEVLFLDEPTTGVDAVSRKEFWDILERISRRGVTIFVSTPYMDEAARCHRVGLMDNGRLLATDSPTGLIAKFDAYLYAFHSPDMYLRIEELRQCPGIRTAILFGDSVHLIADEPLEQEAFEACLDARGFDPHRRWERITPGVEDCFINMQNTSPS